MSGHLRIRVLCYNIRHAQGVGGILSNPRIARVIGRSDCSVAALSEVWRMRRFDQPARLTELTGMASSFQSLDRAMGRQAGNALLSRLPVSDVREIDLGGRRERRGCLLADIDAGDASFVLAATHLSLHRATRASQIETLARELPKDRALILAGDFNCTVGELDALKTLVRFPADVPPTYPSPMPFRALDHIGFSGHWELESLEAVRSWASDHRPLIAQLTLRG